MATYGSDQILASTSAEAHQPILHCGAATDGEDHSGRAEREGRPAVSSTAGHQPSRPARQVLGATFFVAVAAAAAVAWRHHRERGSGDLLRTGQRGAPGPAIHIETLSEFKSAGVKSKSATVAARPASAKASNGPCLRFPGIQLADSPGGAFATVEGDPKKMPDADACEQVCETTSKCKQAIFSKGKDACYMFEQASRSLAQPVGDNTVEPKDEDDLDYHESMFCGVDYDEAAEINKSIQWALQSAEWKLKRTPDKALERWESDRAGKQGVIDAVRENWDQAEQRAEEALGGVDVYDKLGMTRGQKDSRTGYAGYLTTFEAGGDVLTMNDGPQGYNPYTEKMSGTSTQMPALLCLAATFDPEAARKYAKVVAAEFVIKGANVLLGPDVELVRSPLSGRSFETLSGEDPFLGSTLVKPFVEEVQDRGIIATVKHWLDNNQEIFRQSMNVEVDDRTQHEIYMPVFKAAFEAGAGSVMCAYNRVYGEHACESTKLLTDLLRSDLGFRGYVVSDWGAVHDGIKAANAGLDVEMPDGKYFAGLQVEEQSGRIHQMASRVLAAKFAAGHMDGRYPGAGDPKKRWATSTNGWHKEVAKQVIIDGTVLLKNDNNILPLDVRGKTIAMVGKYCDQAIEPAYHQGSVYAGGGSGYVATTGTVTPYEGLQMIAGNESTGAQKIWVTAEPSGANGADIVIVCVAAHAEEGWDREDAEMPEAWNLIGPLRENHSDLPIIVLAITPGAVTTDWDMHADAVIAMFMPGEQVGPAFAEILTGVQEPMGRLPVTMPAKSEERFTRKQYPGECEGEDKWCEEMTADFSEGVLVGYRWNDAKDQEPAYPFGFGLTFTEFEFKNQKVVCRDEKAVVMATVANVGEHDGTAVPQLYVGFKSMQPALRQLRGFRKLKIGYGGAMDIEFFLGPEDWSYWDTEQNQWVSALSKGENVTVFLGTSSRNLSWNRTLSC